METTMSRLFQPPRFGLATLAAVGALALTTPVAHADFISTLNFTNDSALGSGPFGTVDVSLSGNTATIIFTAAAGYGFVDSNVADLQVNATIFTFDSSCAACTSILTATGAGNVDGEGLFNFTSSIGNASTPLSSIEFQLTSAAFTNENTVLAFNADGFDAAAHVSLLSAGGATTGFVGEGSGSTSAPEPGTLALLGSALLSAGFVVRRRRKS
jgi:hypothetical protein